MVNNHYKTAIIGLDAQFEDQQSIQTDIDRVERALYLGKSLGTSKAEQIKPNTTLNMSCSAAVARMARANQVNSADIKVVVLMHDSENTVIDIENVIVVTSLASALQQIDALIEQNFLVALLGFNDKQNSSDVCQELATISYDQNFSAYQACSGIAALLFAPATFAQTHHCYVYSRVKGFATGSDIASVTAAALDKAQVNATDIGLLEVSALSNKAASLAEMQGLMSHYSYKKVINEGANEALNTAISCARSVTGEGAGFSEVLGLLRTVIALQQRYIPAITDWQQPVTSELEQWQSSSCYFPTEARPWYPQPNGNAHLGAYSCLAVSANNHDYCHIILQEEQVGLVDGKHAVSDIRSNGFIACSDLQLVLIGANDLPNLLTQLIDLEDELEQSGKSLKGIALTRFEQSKANSSRYTIALLCESIEELAKEIKLAKAGVPAAFADVNSDKNNQQEWRTPKGSYFSASPVNDIESFTHLESDSTSTNNVSFLYPGIGATYVGLGRDLFHLFPEIHQDVANLADDIGASLKDNLLNPRSIIRPDFKALKQLDLNLRGNLADIAEAGVGFACVFTKVFENVFKVKADFATGYSMGEVSMYAALGAWQQPGLMSARLANSDTFNQRLCGDLLTLREHWGLPSPTNNPSNGSDQAESVDELIWETYTIKATLDDVIAASEGEERVYCTIVNTPDSLLLGGYPADCLRVIKKLGVRAMPLNMANAIHSAPAKIEYDDMVELYTMDVTARLKTKMYSSSCYLPVPQMSKAIAHSVAKCLCDRVDFPRLINTMHNKGARVFIEMGPGRSLCSWVDKILDFDDSSKNGFSNKEPNQESSQIANQVAHKARVSVPVNAKGTSDELTYVRAVAKLVSHGVKLDLHRLFNGSIIVKKPQA